MSWKDILKSNCGTEKEDMDKELIGGQKELDRNNNGRIDAEDFEQLREEQKEDVEAVIIRTLKDEGGASGLEPLEKATGLSKKELKKKLKEMKKVSLHKNGDYILLEGLPKARGAFTDRDQMVKRRNRVRRRKGEPSQKSEKVRPNKPHYKRKER